EAGVALVFLQIVQRVCVFGGNGAAPVIGTLAGDDVDHATHGFGAVERGHRPADDFDAFDHRQWRQADLLAAIAAVGVDRAAGRNGTAVDQVQGVSGGHAANADVLRLAATGHINTRNVLHRIDDI